MSYTPCIYNGKHSQVDGTSYVCVVCLALENAIRHAASEAKKLRWQEELKKLREHNWGTDTIGVTFDRILGDDPDDKQEFIKGLYLAERKIKSFGAEIPNKFLREAIGQGEEIGYIQEVDYAPRPFIKTIRTLLDLLAGKESY